MIRCSHTANWNGWAGSAGGQGVGGDRFQDDSVLGGVRYIEMCHCVRCGALFWGSVFSGPPERQEWRWSRPRVSHGKSSPSFTGPDPLPGLFGPLGKRTFSQAKTRAVSRETGAETRAVLPVILPAGTSLCSLSPNEPPPSPNSVTEHHRQSCVCVRACECVFGGLYG